jgi:hypothetical protein
MYRHQDLVDNHAKVTLLSYISSINFYLKINNIITLRMIALKSLLGLLNYIYFLILCHHCSVYHRDKSLIWIEKEIFNTIIATLTIIPLVIGIMYGDNYITTLDSFTPKGMIRDFNRTMADVYILYKLIFIVIYMVWTFFGIESVCRNYCLPLFFRNIILRVACKILYTKKRCHELGKIYHSNGHFRVARILYNLTDWTDPEVQCDYGCKHGLAQRVDQKIRWLRVSVEQGNEEAKFNLVERFSDIIHYDEYYYLEDLINSIVNKSIKVQTRLNQIHDVKFLIGKSDIKILKYLRERNKISPYIVRNIRPKIWTKKHRSRSKKKTKMYIKPIIRTFLEIKGYYKLYDQQIVKDEIMNLWYKAPEALIDLMVEYI